MPTSQLVACELKLLRRIAHDGDAVPSWHLHAGEFQLLRRIALPLIPGHHRTPSPLTTPSTKPGAESGGGGGACPHRWLGRLQPGHALAFTSSLLNHRVHHNLCLSTPASLPCPCRTLSCVGSCPGLGGVALVVRQHGSCLLLSTTPPPDIGLLL